MAYSNSDKPAAGDFYGATPYKSREGLVARRTPIQSYSGEIKLNIDDLEQGRVDHEITGLRSQVGRLKSVSEKIGTETNIQNTLINQLKQTANKAKAGLKNKVRRMNPRIGQVGSNHVMHVVLFALVCFLVVYLWCKFSGRQAINSFP